MKILIVLLLCFSSVSANAWVEPYIQAELAMQKHELDKAFDLYQRSIEKDPSQAFPYFGLAQVYLERNEYIKAREALDNAKNAKEGFDRENIQKYRVLMMSLAAKTNDIESFKTYQESYLANSYDVPRSFRENGYIYILNAPKSKEFRQFIESTMKKYDGVEEVQWKGEIGVAKVVELQNVQNEKSRN